MSIKLRGIEKRYGSSVVFKNLNLTFSEAAITVILGPSGCGKTTLLNIISGADKDFSGNLTRPADFSSGYLFQEPRLLPWKTVRENLAFVLHSSMSRDQVQQTIEEHLRLVRLRDVADYYPEELSGGMRQRVAMARAFAYPASTILMDEPFQGLDLYLQLQLTKVFLELWENERRTVIYVTHSIQEASLLGDTIVVLSGTPAQAVSTITVPIHQRERTLDRPEISEIERKLYAILTGPKDRSEE